MSGLWEPVLQGIADAISPLQLGIMVQSSWQAVRTMIQLEPRLLCIPELWDSVRESQEELLTLTSEILPNCGDELFRTVLAAVEQHGNRNSIDSIILSTRVDALERLWVWLFDHSSAVLVEVDLRSWPDPHIQSLESWLAARVEGQLSQIAAVLVQLEPSRIVANEEFRIEGWVRLAERAAKLDDRAVDLLILSYCVAAAIAMSNPSVKLLAHSLEPTYSALQRTSLMSRFPMPSKRFNAL